MVTAGTGAAVDAGVARPAHRKCVASEAECEVPDTLLQSVGDHYRTILFVGRRRCTARDGVAVLHGAAGLQRGHLLRADKYTLPGLLNSAALLRAPPAAHALHSLLRVGLASHLHVANALVDAYAKLSRLDAVSYVMLSNLYSRGRRWGEVARICALMKSRGITKEPGCSWVGVNGVTRLFHVEDLGHPRTAEIYEKVEEMTERIRAEGYVPDTATAPIRMFKNLRVCGDCHTAIKMVGKVHGRLIILRDATASIT